MTKDINKVIEENKKLKGIIYRQEYYKKNKDKLLAYSKCYYIKNKNKKENNTLWKGEKQQGIKITKGQIIINFD
tara:strand:+ start:6661 stop:6882 length:222 start_codon:yes stop_codon:yes gene_type:complete